MEKVRSVLGIDVGSVSTNLVVLDENKKLRARCYLPTAGRPIEALRQGLRAIAKELSDRMEIIGVGTTGSGRYLIGELVGADLIKNEITAQAEGALHFDQAVDTIFEIGGQDSKYIALENGVVVDFNMNKACAAGTGSFLEEQAEKLGINIIQEFSRLALSSPQAASLGDRCTVFIESELNHHLQKGASRAELCAGLAVAIVKNYLNKVVENRRIGNHIFFQGGVASNQAVVEAFRKVTGKKITVPPQNDVTGAVGVSLLTLKGQRSEKSKFKGFDLADKKYAIETFECKSCSNLCEINRISLEGETPVLYGGRCEKYERKFSPRFRQLPDLFKEREEIIFQSGALTKEKNRKKIGIPRVLFFFESFPFWSAFFSALGLEVVLSDPSNSSLAEAALEKVAAEACFPITLIYGHIANLLAKEVDYLFLPSLINQEKSSSLFTENFNCPFVQALPYFAKAGFNFPKNLKVLDPPLEPQRGKKYFHKQLIKLGRAIGCRPQPTKKAILRSELALKQAQLKLRQRGKEILSWLEKEKIPSLVIISRSYNGSDPILNLNIPRNLREMGILALPMDYLPCEIKEISADYQNAYWDCEKKIMAAARFISRHPFLSAIHISNFRCGPDSFIAHQIKAEMASKPYLQIEVDGHASDTGVITRLEAFIESLKNSGKNKRESSWSKELNPSLAGRTVYLPRMCDHALVVAAALRCHGIEAKVLPPSDGKTLELGKKFTSGKECHPFIVTTGDFLKKIGEPDFNPQASAFLLGTASGPCRFGHYRSAQELIFKQIGYEDIPLLSPTAQDSYGKSVGLGMRFRRLAWRGLVAIDILSQLTADTRPYENEKGLTDKVHSLYLEKIAQTIERGGNRLSQLVKKMRYDYTAIPLSGIDHKPLIGIVGEIFLRYNPSCNADIVKKIERLGGKTHTAPISEWFYLTNLGFIYESWMQRLPRDLLLALSADLIQKWDEFRLGHRQPSALNLLRKASPYLHYSFKGEATLTVGKAIDLIQKGAAGIISILPFTCMPGTVVSAVSKQIKEDFPGIPWLDVSIDGTEGVNLDTRLEAFIHQAHSFCLAQSHSHIQH